MKYLQTIEALSKSINLHNGEIAAFTKEILKKSTETLKCTRCNAWVFTNDNRELQSLYAYDFQTDIFTVEASLKRDYLPNYFSFLERNEFVVSNEAQLEAYNTELLESYLIPNNIVSMIDVPLRSEGKMIGVVCFEHVNFRHDWSIAEQSFTQSVAQLLSLAIETKEKKKYRESLEKIIVQKEVLLAEINHRVKNNMAIILSLLNIQRSKSSDQFHYQLFSEIKDKVYSIAAVQEQLHSTEEIDQIDLRDYITKLTQNLHVSYDQDKAICVDIKLDKVQLDVSKAIPCGLIVNEVLTNCFKYAFDQKNLFPKLFVSLKKIDENVQLVIQDNGRGFNLNEVKNGMGLDLIEGLAEQLDGKIVIDVADGVNIALSFPHR
ncbi:MAG: histidine kinase dimerization/phosphoacceptor domain -containing protein [Putridiphycobacter sp.]|nr:histidine kinase dimerization/phosphoacceptor domain -containing protein [Putridiphycobacter sp.]